MASGPAAHYSDVELTSALSQAGVTLSDDELGSDSVSGAGPGGSQGSGTELEGDPIVGLTQGAMGHLRRRWDDSEEPEVEILGETLVGSEQASALNEEKKRSEEEVEEDYESFWKTHPGSFSDYLKKIGVGCATEQMEAYLAAYRAEREEFEKKREKLARSIITPVWGEDWKFNEMKQCWLAKDSLGTYWRSATKERPYRAPPDIEPKDAWIPMSFEAELITTAEKGARKRPSVDPRCGVSGTVVLAPRLPDLPQAGSPAAWLAPRRSTPPGSPPGSETAANYGVTKSEVTSWGRERSIKPLVVGTIMAIKSEVVGRERIESEEAHEARRRTLLSPPPGREMNHFSVEEFLAANPGPSKKQKGEKEKTARGAEVWDRSGTWWKEKTGNPGGTLEEQPNTRMNRVPPGHADERPNTRIWDRSALDLE
jgi:hypothetical protein